MPNLGTGLSLGSVSRLSGFDFDASSYILANNISNSAIVENWEGSYSGRFLGSGRLQITSSNFDVTSTGDFSYGGWFMFEDTSSQFFIGFGNGNKIYWAVNTLYWEWGGNNVGSSSYGALNPFRWYHIYVTTSRSGAGQQHKLYVNGALVNTQTYTSNQTISSTPFYVGSGSINEYSRSRIDAVSFYKRTLSASDITWLYNSGTGRSYDEALANNYTSNLVAWWELDEAITGSGNRVDATGNGNTLVTGGTANNVTHFTPKIPKSYLIVNPQTQINDFIVGLKNQNLWTNSIFWIFRKYQSLGTTTIRSVSGGYPSVNATFNTAKVNYNGNAGLAFISTAYIDGAIDYAPISTLENFWIGTGTAGVGSIFSVQQAGNADNFLSFGLDNGAGGRAHPHLYNNHTSALGVVPMIGRVGGRYFHSIRGGPFTPTYNSSTGVFRQNSQVNLRNASVISNETGLGNIDLSGQGTVSRAVSEKGNLPNPGRNLDTQGFALLLLSRTDFTTQQTIDLHNLYKTTLGVGLGLV